MTKKSTSLIALCALIAILILGGFIWHYVYKDIPKVEIGPSLEYRFETTLNTMLEDVQREMRLYKDQRKVFQALTDEENLRGPDYIAENYELMNALSPQLHVRIERIMDIFERTDDQMKALLASDTEKELDQSEESWETLKEKHVTPYRIFFEYEDALLAAHEELMTFYYVNKDKFTFDEDTGAIIYTDPDRALRVSDARAEIKQLSAEQAKAFNRGVQQQTSE